MLRVYLYLGQSRLFHEGKTFLLNRRTKTVISAKNGTMCQKLGRYCLFLCDTNMSTYEQRGGKKVWSVENLGDQTKSFLRDR